MLIPNYSGKIINSIPRIGLGIVFLWFGIDKFLLHEFYTSWLEATERVQVILPIQDTSLAIYSIGVAEIVFAALLFSGIKVRWVSLAVIAWLVTILMTAQYPSSFPQDIGLVGIAVVLFLTNAGWRNAHTERFRPYLRIMRYAIAAVLFLFALDYSINYERHMGWLQLFSPAFSANFSREFILLVIIAIATSLYVLAGAISINKISVVKYTMVAAASFFIAGRIALDPPVNNHQAIALALASAWLGYMTLRNKAM